MTEMDIMNKKQIVMDIINDKQYRPMKIKELAMLLNVPKEERDSLRYVVNLLVEEGKLGISKSGKINKSKNLALTGIYRATTKGFGFVTVEGYEKDFYIYKDNTLSAMNGDIVSIVVLRQGDKDHLAEAKIIQIQKHAISQVVGLYQKNKTSGFVIPDNTHIGFDIYIPFGEDMGAMTGHKVVVKILRYATENKKPEGKIIEILGHSNDPGTDILSIVRAYDIPEQFPDTVMQQACKTPEQVSSKEMAGRKDLRHLQTVTIDGEDAKDLDDAITLEQDGDYYFLGVHIADVSHYVTEGSPLDKEALRRGTSVYLVDRVIPMLPHRLSNGICSLNQGEDRLALSCLMTIDKKGNIIDHQIAETVICVDKRMSYTSVQKIIELHDTEEISQYQDFVPMFERMKDLAAILRQKRKQRGALDFDFPESKIYLDSKGKPTDIRPYERNLATDLIEDFMLAANETVAQDYFWQELPFVYRTHDVPDSEKIEQLATIIRNLGFHLKTSGYGNDVHPKELQKLLSNIADTPEEAFISRIMLRSMKQARYTTHCTGHFGLATSYYCHFTSPIRRYPDLQIHRIIKENLHGKMNAERIHHYHQILEEVSTHSSQMERRADEAERETEKLKKVQYMKQYVGYSFEGIISSVTDWGIYVELENTVEGLVHVNDMVDDFYIFDKENYRMYGQDFGKVYTVGQKVQVIVESIDIKKREINFLLRE